ncbi:AMP-dependent synthetase and ligase [Candidatus Vecturithrix granuli]|uniref:AMP-dependent synthetase and ligase n=1 Tax=Vecturithrix granuli TaxID=1499967 RepID=A0A0S6WAD3_VECG1|nr:AMP-dependent synthetase and ligase [Candidatus Vecturithrix granuli]
MTHVHIPYYENIETTILQRFDVVKEIGVFQNHNGLQAIIYPDFAILQQRRILNIQEFIRLDVIEQYNHRTLPAQKIHQCTIVKQPLPKTPQGSISRELLPGYGNRVSQKSERSGSVPEFQEYRMIETFLSKLSQQTIFPDDHFDLDLGLSSLDKVRFQIFLEETFGLALTEVEWVEYCTVQTLAEYLRKKCKESGQFFIPAPKSAQADWGNIFISANNICLPQSRFPHTLILNIVKTFVRLYFKLEASGDESLPDSPMILVANHQSFLDGFIIARFLSNEFLRRLFVCATEKHFHTPFRRFVADTSNVIIVNINCRLKEPLQKMAAILQQGENILIFPEGTRTKNGCLGSFKKFFAVLSCELNIPVVPVVIQGAFHAMPTGRAMPKLFKKIQVRFLPPVYPENKEEVELVENVRQEMLKYVM